MNQQKDLTGSTVSQPKKAENQEKDLSEIEDPEDRKLERLKQNYEPLA